jgi:hypothetical protein
VARLRLHARHRYSLDHDHVLPNLDAHFGKATRSVPRRSRPKLAAPDPYDLTDVDLTEYKGIIAPGTTGVPWKDNAGRSPSRYCDRIDLQHAPFRRLGHLPHRLLP